MAFGGDSEANATNGGLSRMHLDDVDALIGILQINFRHCSAYRKTHTQRAVIPRTLTTSKYSSGMHTTLAGVSIQTTSSSIPEWSSSERKNQKECDWPLQPEGDPVTVGTHTTPGRAERVWRPVVQLEVRID